MIVKGNYHAEWFISSRSEGLQLIKWIKGLSEMEHQQEPKMKVSSLGKDFTCLLIRRINQR